MAVGCLEVAVGPGGRCLEAYEPYVPEPPGPTPVEAPACEKTADCEEAGATCCVHKTSITTDLGLQISGMAVGCLAAAEEDSCLEEFKIEDITPPEPEGPYAPACAGGSADCNGEAGEKCCYYAYTDILDGISIKGVAVGCIAD